MGAKVDNQVAAPAETRTPPWHRASIAHKRVRMEGWRQRRPGSNGRDHREEKKNRLDSHRPSHGRSWPAAVRVLVGRGCINLFPDRDVSVSLTTVNSGYETIRQESATCERRF